MPSKKNYAGLKYGILTIVRLTDRRGRKTCWIAKCDCGNELTVLIGDVVSGHTKSCGCFHSHKDYTGQRHHRLTFLEFVEMGKRSSALWRFTCDCGNVVIRRANDVLNGQTKSCGCIKKLGEATFINKSYGTYARNATSRGLNFSITKEEFSEIVHRPCFYCGVKSSNVWRNEKTDEYYFYNGIDRVDNSKGYAEENVVACCKHCNWSKKDLSQSEFLSWIETVHSHQEHKKEIDYAVNNLFEKVGNP